VNDHDKEPVLLIDWTGPEPPRQIRTGRREHLAFDAAGPVPGGLYSVSTWDHEEEEWEPYRWGVRLMALRTIIRGLELAGWGTCSYLVERE
jgi:hypothetical protein